MDRGVDHVDASGTAAVIIQRGGSADGQVALDRAAADIERIVIYAGHFERDGIAKDLGHIAFQGAALGNRAAFALDIDVGGGGAQRLALVIEGAVRAPAVHVRSDVGDGESGAVFAADIRVEIAAEVGHGVLAAGGGDERPAQRFKGVGAGHEQGLAADLFILVGGILGDHEVLDLVRGLGGGDGRDHGGRGGGGSGAGNAQRGGARHGEDLGGCLGAAEHGIAVGQTDLRVEISRREPGKAGAAALAGGKLGGTGGVVCLYVAMSRMHEFHEPFVQFRREPPQCFCTIFNLIKDGKCKMRKLCVVIKFNECSVDQDKLQLTWRESTCQSANNDIETIRLARTTVTS